MFQIETETKTYQQQGTPIHDKQSQKQQMP